MSEKPNLALEKPSEIALLRVKIKTLLESGPDDFELLLKTTDALSKLVKTRYSITRKENKGLREAINNVIKDVAVPLGITVLNKKL
jgi:hypothetical protein